MSFELGIIMLAVLTAVNCSLSGVFLVLRKKSMMSDAVSHAILPGIVIGLLFTRSLESPFLIVGAALMGMVIVFVTEYLENTRLLKGDASLGLIFPALFAIGVILVSLEFSNVHLDEHIILVGDINFAAFFQLEINGVSIGPSYMYVLLAVLLLNVAFITVFYKEMKISTFDPSLAYSLGFKPRLINYMFMFLVSITITSAFYVAGSILTIALMIAPAASAFLLTKRLFPMLLVSTLIAASTAIGGFYTAYALDAATSGAMATFCGVFFVFVFLFSPYQGIIAKQIRHRRKRNALKDEVLASEHRSVGHDHIGSDKVSCL
ncbi:metal ABC transporter permease [Vibrio nigripulchritudo]|uniref:metal ABC transporter permease n=1 Tax=Vibrio nigripulchritudo TaxID=28173 RepID=UPI0024907287|nr:metal ABC transporter permease [Vibrio nigripulchritudo]BDU39710.1 zinc ABC transporter permease [Vibrio nigripulchritudo]BDU45433.1 zinc ABC transporter permease [Vibrio nigripulchritudo]